MLRKIKRIFKKKSYNYTKKFKSYDLAENSIDKLNLYYDKRYTKKFFGPENVESVERFYAASVIAALFKKKKVEYFRYRWRK